jgi:hypothetical protein
MLVAADPEDSDTRVLAGIKSNLGWSYGLQALEMGSLFKALS